MIISEGRKMNFRLLIVLLGLLLAAGSLPVLGQRVIVQAKVDKQEIAIGELLQYSLSIFVPEGTVVNFPVFRPNNSSKLEIVETGRIDSTLNSNGSITIKQDITFTSYDTGQHVIPSLNVPYQLEGSYDTALTNHIDIRVAGTAVDFTQDIKDIRPPVPVPFSWREIIPYLFYIISFILLLGGGFYAWIYLKKDGAETETTFQKPSEPAHITALRLLDSLKQGDLLQKKQVHEFHGRISDYTRRYIQGRFNIQAMEKTSPEILSYFKREKIDKKTLDALEQILILADQVKFAKVKPKDIENEGSLSNAYYFINHTKETEGAHEEQ
ncbi:MAG: BatD family protein [Bacteroidota bacterium]|nr:BatD family protein [Bacteroidota bacterium]